MEQLVSLEFDSIRLHQPSSQHALILKELGSDRYLPIWLGAYEAHILALNHSKTEPGRPLTHDLLSSVLRAANFQIEKVLIEGLDEGVFFATIATHLEGRLREFDCRPSDAINIALRFQAPIFTTRAIMARAAITFDDEGQVNSETPLDPALTSRVQEWVNALDIPDPGPPSSLGKQ